MADYLLPGQRGQMADKDGIITPPWYSWARWVTAQVATANTTATAAAAAVAAATSTTDLPGLNHSPGLDVYGDPNTGQTIVLNGDGPTSPIVSQIFGS